MKHTGKGVRHARLLAGLVLGMALMAPPAMAQSFPESPVTLVVTYAPGGGTDTYARAIAPYWATQLGTNVVVENWEGAGGRIGMSRVARSKPDGYTTAIESNFALAMSDMQAEIDYDVAALSYLGSVSESGRIMLTSAQSDLKTFQDALARPIKVGVAGRGSNDHIQNIVINNVIGADVSYVFYEGTSEALAGLLRGEIDVAQPPLETGLKFVNDGLARALVVHQAERSEALPDVPSIAEAGFPQLVSITVSTRVLVAPPGVPDDVLAVLRTKLAAACSDPALTTWGVDNGFPLVCRDAEAAKASVLGVQELVGEYRDLLSAELQ